MTRSRMTRRDLLRTGAAIGLGALAGTRVVSSRAEALPGNDYRALVCVNMMGGADQFSMLVPYAQEEWNTYAATRGSVLALPRESLLPISGEHAGGRRFALHASMQPLVPLFDAGTLAFVSNSGPMIEPTTLAAFRAGTARVPEGLREHPVQAHFWQTAHERAHNDESAATSAGVLGRMLDHFAPGSAAPLAGLPAAGTIGAKSTILNGAFGEPVHFDVPMLTDELKAVLESAPDAEADFPGYYLAQQYRLVARLCAAGKKAGYRRQIFYVPIGTWDFHKGGLEPHGRILTFLGASLAGFQRGLVTLGLDREVTTFTVTEFGRQLAYNGSGTDHGWGGLQLVMGGAVNGGRIYGDVPEPVLGGARDIGLGSFIPDISVDEFYADLALWFGIPPSGVTELLPNLGRFHATGPALVPPLGLLRNA